MSLPAPVLDRNRIARRLLIILAGFSIVALFLERNTNNFVIQALAVTLLVTAPAVLWLARRLQQPALPRHFLLILMAMTLLAGNLSQLHRPANLFWMPIFPVVFFYLGSLRTGLALSVLGAVSLLLGYLFYGHFQPSPPVGTIHFIQLVSAYAMCTLLAFLYEHENNRNQRLLLQQATQDYLTGLPNRRGFDQIAAAQISQSRRLSHSFSVILFDVDGFKSVNDRFGHDAGDQLLREIARLVEAHIRGGDVLARWGGEEFIVLAHQCNLENAMALAEKLRSEIASHPFSTAGGITASFGVAESAPQEAMDKIIARADRGLYKVKLSGKNRVETDTA